MKKMSKGRRAYFLSRTPAGWAVAEVLDQTIGFWSGDRSSAPARCTTVHREAFLYASEEAATRAINAVLARRARQLNVPVERLDCTPWIERVNVWRHWCDRPDTW